MITLSPGKSKIPSSTKGKDYCRSSTLSLRCLHVRETKSLSRRVPSQSVGTPSLSKAGITVSDAARHLKRLMPTYFLLFVERRTQQEARYLVVYLLDLLKIQHLGV